LQSAALKLIELGYGVWNEFYIGNIGNTSTFPGKQAIQNDIFDNGVSPTQFFNGLNGWNFNFNYEYSGWLAAGAIGRNSLLVSITNQSPDTVTVSATVAAHEGFLFRKFATDPWTIRNQRLWCADRGSPWP